MENKSRLSHPSIHYLSGFDRDIFSGSPSLKHLVDTYKPKLTAEEEDFVHNKVDRLCALLNDHDVSTKKDFTKEAWDYMRDEKFFGMKIPKEYGGLGFSTQAVSATLACTYRGPSPVTNWCPATTVTESGWANRCSSAR